MTTSSSEPMALCRTGRGGRILLEGVEFRVYMSPKGVVPELAY